MKWLALITLCIVLGVGFWWLASGNNAPDPVTVDTIQPTNTSANTATPPINTEQTAADETPTVAPEFVSPLDRPDERITKKPFGIYITPATSPVQPERFSGYHTGVDFEIFPDELDQDVMVHAFCSGPILAIRTVNGYGGVVVQSCTIDGQSVTALYGHLKLSSVTLAVGETINPGDDLALLGDAYSSETDGERKHLHFSLHRGSAVEYRGYVSTESALDQWIDPQDYF